MSPERFEQISRVYNEVAELPTGARAAFLEATCADDSDLRREVESLLAAEQSVGDFIAGPALKDAAALLTRETPASLVGQQLGPYQILSFIGAGGMGEVYAARDARLGRKVAIKLLPATLAQDAGRLARFEYEARAVGMLNHPNILTLHDVGAHTGAPYLVSELLEGETLRERLKSGPLPLARAVEYALQITQGLAAAHQHGLAHRDLKPENLYITNDGRIKILDFGLAKITELRNAEFGLRIEESATVNESHSQPALHLQDRQNISNPQSAIRNPQLTAPGLVMGTVGYMAPEQLRGEEADLRADIFAFGVVLYEMLAGMRPFRGNSAAETMSSVLTHEPPELPASVGAPGLERIIRRCLEKQPQHRFQSASDLGFAIEALTSFSQPVSQTSGAAPVQAATSMSKRALLGWILAGVFLCTTIGFAAAYFHRPAISPRVVPFTSFTGQKASPVFSPDGNQIAFVWNNGESEPGLYVKLIDAGTPLRLASMPAGRFYHLGWSPDGRFIAFARMGNDGGIFAVPALGGPERKLTDLAGAFSWSPDGKSLAVASGSASVETQSIYLVTLATGETRRLTDPQTGSYGDSFPAFSPDGETLAFIRNPGFQVNDLYLIPVRGGEPKRLTFDNLELNGGLTWTADGKEIIFSSPRGGLPSLWRVPVAGGTPVRLPGTGEYAFDPSIARQGNRLAYVYNKVDRNIWRVTTLALRSTAESAGKLIASTREDVAADYSPDSKRIVFVSDRSGSREIWVCDEEGQNAVQLTNFGGSHAGTPHWSPDGRQIAFDSRPEGRSNIYAINADGGSPRRVSDGTAEDVRPSWSRDGKWIYFGSWRTGSWQIWKMPASGGPAVQVTRNGGFEAFESADGKLVYYTKREPGIWSIPVDGGEERLVMSQGEWGGWSLLPEGICWIDRPASPPASINFFNFATARSFVLLAFDKTKPRPIMPSASPDGRWILYTQVDQIDNDIMLVENFR